MPGLPEPADVIVFAPHPDDAEFGVGGSVVRWVAEGKQVIFVICTNGDKGTSDRNISAAELVKIREQEQRAAAKTLGAREVVFLGYPDQSLEDTPEFRKALVREIRKYRPHTVATTDPYRRYLYHRDHRITGRVVLDAVFPYARDYLAYPDLIEEGLEPHKVVEVLMWGSENPNYWIDVTDVFDTKLASLACHKSQLGDPLSEEMIKRTKQRNQDQAEGQDFELAEAFYQSEMRR